MKLSVAARFFDRTSFLDGYSGLPLFKGRLLPFEDSTRDSLSVERRIMSVAPSVAVPPRRAVSVGAGTFLVGDGTNDMHGDEVLRRKYVLHAATEQALIRTFPQALGMEVGTKQAWSARAWVKGNREQVESSGIYDHYHMYFAIGEDVRSPQFGTGTFFDGYDDNLLIQLAGRWHIVRSTYQSTGGFQVVAADELPEPVLTTVSVASRVYSARLGTYTESSVEVPAINLRWQSSFAYTSQQSIKFEAGDAQVIVPKAGIAPKAGDHVTIAGRKLKVVSVFDMVAEQCWRLHLRHA